VTYGTMYNRSDTSLTDEEYIRAGSDLRHDVRQIYIYIYIYRKFTANSSMWGSLRLAPIIYPEGGVACALLGSNRQCVVEQTMLPVNTRPSASR